MLSVLRRIPHLSPGSAFSNVRFCSLQSEVNEARGKWGKRVGIQLNEMGWGLYAARLFEANEFVFSARGLEVSESRHSHSVQTDWRAHTFMDLPGRFINHSCDANCGIKDNQLGAYDFYALRKIEKNEVLTWDYCSAEYDPLEGFSQCICGSAFCRGELKGFREHGDLIKQRYGMYYADYLKR